MKILEQLKYMKPGEHLNIRYHDIDDMQIPWDDPFGHPNRDEKIEWLHSELFRLTKSQYESMNNVAQGHYVFRR